MAVSGKIADGFIKIALDGFETAKAKLQTLQVEAKKVGESLSTIGSISARGFAVATGSIVGFLKAADPVRFTFFTQKLMILSMHIGQIFIPVLKEAITIVDRMIDTVRKLTPHQQDQILKWTKIVVSILAVGAAIGIAVKAITTLITVLRALAVIVGILESESGVGLVLALLALGLAIYEVIKHSKEFEPVLDALENAWETLKEAMKPIIDTFKQIFAQIQAMQASFIQKLVPILNAVVHAFERLIPPITTIIGIFMQLYQTYANSAMKMFDHLTSKSGSLIPLIQKFGHYVEDSFNRFATVLKAVQPSIEKLIEAFVELYGTVVELVMEVIGDLISELSELAKSYWDVFGDATIAMVKGVVWVIREMVKEIKQAVDTAKKLYELYSKFKEGIKNALDHLNPFTEGSREDRKEKEKQKLEQERKNDEARDKNKHDEKQKKKDEDNKRQKEAPLRAGKAEFFGVEEAFRRAQKGAELDPTKEYQKALLNEQQKGNTLLGEVAENTRQRPKAEEVY